MSRVEANSSGMDFFDPRQGEDWSIQLPGRRSFSSLQNDFLVVDSQAKSMLAGLAVTFPPVTDLREHGDLLSKLIVRTNPLGFVISDPTPAELRFSLSRIRRETYRGSPGERFPP